MDKTIPGVFLFGMHRCNSRLKGHCLRVFYLVDGDVVSRLLEIRRVVVAVSDDDADFVQNNRADQLVGALHLNHDGVDVRGRLGESRKQRNTSNPRIQRQQIINQEIN